MNTRVPRRATAALLLVLAACSPATDIGSILDNPRKYADQTVTVSGDVRDTFGLGALKYYTVTDRTGSIRVMTERPLPKQGEHIRVTGRVEEAFSFGSQTSVVLVEEKPKK
ncbi:MAG TPA: OB-fold nucleic acid binding domain-containing protein [Burkholderiales bacterium]|nr:OB-fold nucleic acid binding domain-containing protein [Burkholderiales bacterium]